MSSDLSDKEYLVLARKYRPQAFGELVGQEHVTAALRNAIASNRIAHAFLFTGIRGVGKTTAARLLAKALNCERSPQPTADPCGECSNCVEIRESRSSDVAEIDGASNRGIDSIRELTENVRYLPIKSRFRVYIIDEAHMVTREAFNALLKTLEEPPPHVKFIFATTAAEKFPETIVSRCQRFDFKRIALGRIKDELARIAEREGVKLTDAALFAIAREGQGSLRDAESLLERMTAFAGETIDDSKVGEVLGVADRKTLFAAADALLTGDARTALELVDRIYESGRDLERFSRDLLEHLRNLVVTRIGADAAMLAEIPPEEMSELRRQASIRDRIDLDRLFRIALEGDEELSRSSVPRLVLEMTLVRMATIEPVMPIETALRRLDEIQKGIGASAPPSRPAPSPAPVRVPERTAAPAERAAAAKPAAAAPPVSPSEPAPTRNDAPVASASGVAASPAANGEGRWPELLAFVQSKKLALGMTLSHARLLAFAPGLLTLGVAKEKFRLELSSRATQSQVESLATDFYGVVTRVRVEAASEEAPVVAPPPTSGEMLDHPSVKAAVEILGGEVREVRPRR